MREIKFRGIPVKTEAWVAVKDGDFVYGYLCAPDQIIMWDEKKAVGKCIQVIPATVGQQVGKQDDDGEEIYEADIVEGQGEWGSTTCSKVIFSCDGAQVEIGDNWVNLTRFTEIKIIGNTNQEILKNKNREAAQK